MLNPKRPGCASEDKDLAAVGVAFKLALALTRAMGGNENLVYGMLDLVALATIADIAPLRGENRVFARYGLKMLAETKNIGLRALIRVGGARQQAAHGGPRRASSSRRGSTRWAGSATRCAASSCCCPPTSTRPTASRASWRS